MDQREMTRLIYRAYIRDGDREHSGEALLLACLMHSKGKKDKDFADVQRIMRDINYDGKR